jgi:hypothetical protein
VKKRLLVPLVCLGLGVVVAGGGWLLVVKPQRQQVQQLDLKIAGAQTQLATLRGTEPGTAVVGAPDLFRLAQAMPSNDDVPGILLNLSRLARASKLKLVAVRPSPRETLATGAAAVPVDITVDGSWRGLTSFLRAARQQVALRGTDLAVTGRLFDVDDIQVTAAQAPTEIEAVLSLSAFDYGAPPSESATAGTANASTTTSTTATTTTSSGGAG